MKSLSKNKFRLSEDKSYWIGTTQNGYDFYFDGDDKTIEYIKSYTWRRTHYGYFQNKKGERLHRIVMGITDPDVYISNKEGKRYDSRRIMLEMTDEKGFSKRKNSVYGNSGVVGLLKRGNKWVGNVKVNNLSIYSKYKTKEEALIDLLIIQKHYSFKHNEKLYYMLKDITKDRVDDVISNCERQLALKHEHKNRTANKYELSSDGKYYNVYDKKSNIFKVDLDSIPLLKKGIWHVATDKTNGKKYVHGFIIQDGLRVTVKFHRYIMGLVDKKYKRYLIDHLNGDGLDNRKTNMIITDIQGNGVNKPRKGYYKRKDSPGWRANITIKGKKYSKTLNTELEAKEWSDSMYKYSLDNRLILNNKQELDNHIKINYEKGGLSV